jgi:hypothetical protein
LPSGKYSENGDRTKELGGWTFGAGLFNKMHVKEYECTVVLPWENA